MKRRPQRCVPRALAMGVVTAVASGLVASACGSSPTLVGPGGECFLATDCAPGLVCLEQPNKTRICSDDLTRVAGRPPGDGGPAADDGGETGSFDGSTDAPIVPPQDSGEEDTGSDTGVPDSGEPPDSGGD